MSAGFTPGPWHWMADLGRDHMPVLIGSDGLPICDFGMETTYYPVEGTPPEAANARLIAAAPELYEALLLVSRNSGKLSNADWQMVEAALAKARGEAL